ncbi:MAG TPA: NAD(P)/FAD-dependent oxidoreductase [Acidimicrobiales bacterium]
MGQPDVIVIGAGHNGLTAACYLAKAGLSVEVVEANPNVGGMTSSEWGVFPDAPDHGIVSAALDVVFIRTSTIVDDFDLQRAGLSFIIPDPGYVYLDSDGASIAMWRDPARTATEIARFSRRDAETWIEMCRDLDRFVDVADQVLPLDPVRPGLAPLARLVSAAVRRAPALKRIGRLLLAPPNETITERFEHQMTRDMVAPLISSGGPLSDPGSGAAFMYLGYYHRLGVARIAGGTQKLADALTQRFGEMGGSIRTNAPVERILVDGGRTTGIRLASGEEVRARLGVMASCDARTALLRLLPEGSLSDKHRVRAERIPVNRDGTGDLKIDVAMSGRLGFSRHEQWRDDGVDLRIPVQLVGSMEDHNRAYAYSAAGHLAPEPAPFWGAILNSVDPSMSPEGQDTVYFWSGWVPSSPKGVSNDEFRGMAGKALMSTAAEFYDGIEELKIGERVMTSDDLAMKFNATKGSPSHVDWTLGRFGPFRPAPGFGGYRSPLEGYYLTGASTHPGLGCQGFPGQNAARRFLKDTRRARR